MSGWAVRKDGLGYRAVDSKDDCSSDELFRKSPPVVDDSPTAYDVDAERDRRIDAGMDFGAARFQTRAGDRENIAGAAQVALAAIVSGAQPGDLRWSDPDKDFTWITADNSLVAMDAQAMLAFGKAAAARKQSLIFAARAIKDMEAIPADYTADTYWP